ncbi:transposase [Clostridium pasteurianum]|uniref:Transposase n=1 Tax=Clostridium pasteurianum BC1 TaxID=86416 RepID=R4K2B8_CLOPA|nr:transposase [Clostridium pasteurianum]AGK96718.1 transposase [Clostridium pasteurianum BC1]
MSSNGNRYNSEFKADAVRLVTKEGRSVRSVAKDLGISDQAVRNWINKDNRKHDPEKSRIDELKEKQKRIDDLEDSVDILKKAAALFVQDNRK